MCAVPENSQVTLSPGLIVTRSGRKDRALVVTLAPGTGPTDPTLTVAVAVRLTPPEVREAVMVADPAPTPVPSPVALTVAIAALLDVKVAAGRPVIALPF